MKATLVCIIDGCDRPVQVIIRGLCRAHYLRWHRYGDPLADHQRQRGVCSIESCDREHWANGYCDKHYHRWRRYGDPLLEDQRSSTSGNYRGADARYSGAHRRLVRLRGRADDHLCQHCDARAREWAYDHGDPDEQIDSRLDMPFSLDPEHYVPLCKPCHKRFDNEFGLALA